MWNLEKWYRWSYLQSRNRDRHRLFLFNMLGGNGYMEWLLNFSCNSWWSLLIKFVIVVLSQLCPTLCSPMDCSTPGFPILHCLLEFAQTHVHRVNDAIQPPLLLLLLLPSIFPSIGIFFNELAVHIRWPKYWNFSISPFNEYSGLISFWIDWFDLLAVQGSLKSPLQNHN